MSFIGRDAVDRVARNFNLDMLRDFQSDNVIAEINNRAVNAADCYDAAPDLQTAEH